MQVELHGTGKHNAGAAMMEEAVRVHFANRFPEAIIRVVNCMPGRKARAFSTLGRLFPKIARFAPDLLLDASGLAYSDDCSWSRAFFDRIELRLKRLPAKTQVIFLPQTFGPFRSQETRERMRRLARRANLIFARERSSYETLLPLVDDVAKLHTAPDFTLSRGAQTAPPIAGSVLIVPNSHVCAGDSPAAVHYADLLSECAVAAAPPSKSGPRVTLAVQSTFGDADLVQPLLDALRQKGIHSATIVKVLDPSTLRRLVAEHAVVVGSRYHTLVTALREGRITFGLGWNAKYDDVFDLYNVSQNLFSLDMPMDRIRSRVVEFLGKCASGEWARTHAAARALHERGITYMWDHVDTLASGQAKLCFPSAHPAPT